MGRQEVSPPGNGSAGSQSSSDELSAALDLLLLGTGSKKTQPFRKLGKMTHMQVFCACGFSHAFLGQVSA